MSENDKRKGVILGFERESVIVPLSQLVPLKVMKWSAVYAQIVTRTPPFTSTIWRRDDSMASRGEP